MTPEQRKKLEEEMDTTPIEGEEIDAMLAEGISAEDIQAIDDAIERRKAIDDAIALIKENTHIITPAGVQIDPTADYFIERGKFVIAHQVQVLTDAIRAKDRNTFTLNLQSISIDDEGAVALADAIAKATQPLTLNLQGTTVSNAGVKALTDAVVIQNKGVCISISLDEHSITNEAFSVYEAIKEMQRVITAEEAHINIDLQNQNIGNVGYIILYQEFQRALSVNPEIKITLDLRGNEMDPCRNEMNPYFGTLPHESDVSIIFTDFRTIQSHFRRISDIIERLKEATDIVTLDIERQVMSETETIKIAEAVKYSNAKSITLRTQENSISKILIDALMSSEAKSIDLFLVNGYGRRISSEGMQALANAIANTKAEKMLLSIDGLGIENEDAAVLARAIEGARSIHSIDLRLDESNYNLRGEGVEVLARAIECKRYASLNLSDNYISNQEITSLSKSLQTEGNIALTLERCYFTNQQLQRLAQAIIDSEAKSIALNLSYHENKVDEVVAPLARAIETTRVENLCIHLDSSKISNEGMLVLANAIVNTGVKNITLILRQNQIGDEGIRILANAISNTKAESITLDLSENEIGDAGGLYLAQAIANAKATQTIILDLQLNRIDSGPLYDVNIMGPQGFQVLAESLKATRACVHIEFNNIDNDVLPLELLNSPQHLIDAANELNKLTNPESNQIYLHQHQRENIYAQAVFKAMELIYTDMPLRGLSVSAINELFRGQSTYSMLKSVEKFTKDVNIHQICDKNRAEFLSYIEELTPQALELLKTKNSYQSGEITRELTDWENEQLENHLNSKIEEAPDHSDKRSIDDDEAEFLSFSSAASKKRKIDTEEVSSSSGNNDDDPDEGSDGNKSNAVHSENANSDALVLESEDADERDSNATDNVFYANDPDLLVLDQDIFIIDGDADTGTRATRYTNPTKAKKADDTSIEELEIYLETMYEVRLNNDTNSKAYEIEDAPSAEVLETYSAEVTFAGITDNSNMIAA